MMKKKTLENMKFHQVFHEFCSLSLVLQKETKIPHGSCVFIDMIKFQISLENSNITSCDGSVVLIKLLNPQSFPKKSDYNYK